MKQIFKKLATSVTLGALAAASGIAHAGNLSLAETPLFLTNAVEPNVFFLLDDSGSMDWEVLVEGEGAGGLGWDDDRRRSVAYVYDFPNRLYTNFYHPVEDEEQDANERYWRFKSSQWNAMYYNPALTYEPWAGTNASGVPLYEDASPTAAPIEAADPGEGRRNLTVESDLGGSGSDFYPAKYYIWNDADNDGRPDRNEYTVYEIRTGSSNSFTNDTTTNRAGRTDCVAAPVCTYTEEMQNFANWFTYYRKRSYVAWAAIGSVIANANAVRTGIYRFTDGLHSADGQSVFRLSDTNDKKNILDELYCDTGQDCQEANSTPARRAMDGLGEYFRGSNSPILPSGDGGKCQQNFNITFTDGFWNGSDPFGIGNDDGDGDTDFDGGHYADNYSDTLADVAMYFYENDLKTGIENLVPMSDFALAEAAKDAGETNPVMHQHLVTYTVAFGLTGTLDPFGTETPGDDSDTDPEHSGFAWPNPIANSNEERVDDLWHAAYNGRGSFFSAKNPDELTKALDKVISSIADRTSSSSSVALSSGFLNSGSLLFQARFDSSNWTGQLLAYSINADENSTNFGSVGGLQWDAGCVLTGGDCTATIDVKEDFPGQDWNAGRSILTTNTSTGNGVAFRWGNLSAEQQTFLKTNPDTLQSDSVGEDRLEYLRGARISDMRPRSSLLGDIINSNPVYVASPTAAYPDSLEANPYSAFANAKASRTPMIYVGANDGMLHGFDASTNSTKGEEKIAYVPGEVYRNLPDLTSNNYGGSIGHRSFVDASATAGDVYFGGSWKTILVGALGKGGQGIYALDISDPTDFSEGNASSLVLWEFTDEDDADLGYTYGQPAIVRLANGSWAAVVSNGYNNTDQAGGEDTSFSTSGNGVLYLIDVSNGSLLGKFDTGKGTADDPTGAARPNGLTTPSPVDINGDRIVDYIYVPDLFGNVWKIDVSSSNSANWDFAYYSGSNPQPLFVTEDSSGTEQPITTKVEVGLHPTQAGQLVYVGTGKYIEDGDNSSVSQQTQTVYAIWDRNQSTNGLSVITRSHLLEQEINEETKFNSSADVRISTTTEITWYTGTGLPSSGQGYLGWYMDLYNTEGGNTNNYGERMVSDPVLRDGKIIFVTLLPLEDPCDFGGDSWLMELDANSGARLPTSPFDLNGDGTFSPDDFATSSGGDAVPVSGVKSTVGILPTPGILKDNTSGYAGGSGGSGGGGGGGREFKYFSGSSGGIQAVTESRGTAGIGRQSWREIFSE